MGKTVKASGIHNEASTAGGTVEVEKPEVVTSPQAEVVGGERMENKSEIVRDYVKKIEGFVERGRQLKAWYSEPFKTQPSDTVTLELTYMPGGVDQKRGKPIAFPESVSLGIRLGFKNKLLVKTVKELNELRNILNSEKLTYIMAAIQEVNEKLGAKVRTKEAVELEL